jgi:hypothetical protein
MGAELQASSSCYWPVGGSVLALERGKLSLFSKLEQGIRLHCIYDKKGS